MTDALMNSAPAHAPLSAIFISLELSRSTWLVTALSPASGEKMSKFSIAAGDTAELFSRISILRDRSLHRTGNAYPIITIQEAGLDGFWLHRVLTNEGIESNVVDPASITVSRRRRRAKTDRLDGEILLRTLMAHTRGEPHVCAMVHVPSSEEEDQRRISRERKTLIGERVTHVNRWGGHLLTASQCAKVAVSKRCYEEVSMHNTIIIGIDLAKNLFQLHGMRADGAVAFRRKVSRARLLPFLAEHPACLVAMEACASAHYWGREIEKLGHDVRLIAPQYVKPYVK